MNHTATQLPTTPAALADHIQAASDRDLIRDLTAQLGWTVARPLLAAAHSTVADRLWNS
ncbi:hypothetical protein O3Q52_17560 [Streptomyces sp. ActVer]|uniref:hypothetical protein n=1 Tax=Streptomyces sp. ActVer TaxID=3014558 RepID=UPI0022B39012|nr:hypothetical protein [Streptomyces sp. ActVer]MCZ4509973.1 hypothetical protein [Streptomyces sp. ActVer]